MKIVALLQTFLAAVFAPRRQTVCATEYRFAIEMAFSDIFNIKIERQDMTPDNLS